MRQPKFIFALIGVLLAANTEFLAVHFEVVDAEAQFLRKPSVASSSKQDKEQATEPIGDSDNMNLEKELAKIRELWGDMNLEKELAKIRELWGDENLERVAKIEELVKSIMKEMRMNLTLEEIEDNTKALRESLSIDRAVGIGTDIALVLKNFAQAIKNWEPMLQEAIKNWEPMLQEAIKHWEPKLQNAIKHWEPKLQEAIKNWE